MFIKAGTKFILSKEAFYASEYGQTMNKDKGSTVFGISDHWWDEEYEGKSFSLPHDWSSKLTPDMAQYKTVEIGGMNIPIEAAVPLHAEKLKLI